MRIGVLSAGIKELDWVHSLGLRSVEWMRFSETPAGPQNADWKPFAQEYAAACASRDIRISCIGAFYRNPLDPKQSETARAIVHRAIEIAELIGVRTVSGFMGAVVESEVSARGGNVVYKPFENYFPQILAFWEPIAKFAADRGVRLAFENCPQGIWRLPVMNYNILGQPAMWERLFNETRCANIGLEWDPSHLMCQLIDPVANLHKFGTRIFHVHAKDAYMNPTLLATYGICHPGVAEHRFPGLGQANWPEIVHALMRAGYDSDLSIEGWHDPVYRNHDDAPNNPQRGQKLEDTGVLLAKKLLEPLVAGTEPTK